MFDTSGFMQVFEDHGLATRAFRASLPGSDGFIVGFERPEDLILGDAVQTAHIMVEFNSNDAPNLVVGEELTIKGVSYRVRNKPQPKGDGSFSKVELEKARP